MTKMRITVEERVSYFEELVVEIPAGMDDDDFNDSIREVERKMTMLEGSVEDMASELENKHGILVHNVTSSFPENPEYKDFEVIDVREEQ